MLVTYRTSKLQKTLVDHEALHKKYGERAAKKMVKRMTELDAAETLADMPPAARVHPYEPKKLKKFSVDILKHENPLRLMIEALEDYEDGDYSQIKEIKVLEIKKNHS